MSENYPEGSEQLDQAILKEILKLELCPAGNTGENGEIDAGTRQWLNISAELPNDPQHYQFAFGKQHLSYLEITPTRRGAIISSYKKSHQTGETIRESGKHIAGRPEQIPELVRIAMQELLQK